MTNETEPMLVTMKSHTETVFVRLLDEGTDVMRPASATFISGDVYELIEADNYDPEYETWEFPPGSRVHCEKRRSGADDLLVAVARAV